MVTAKNVLVLRRHSRGKVHDTCHLLANGSEEIKPMWQKVKADESR